MIEVCYMICFPYNKIKELGIFGNNWPQGQCWKDKEMSTTTEWRPLLKIYLMYYLAALRVCDGAGAGGAETPELVWPLKVGHARSKTFRHLSICYHYITRSQLLLVKRLFSLFYSTVRSQPLCGSNKLLTMHRRINKLIDWLTSHYPRPTPTVGQTRLWYYIIVSNHWRMIRWLFSQLSALNSYVGQTRLWYFILISYHWRMKLIVWLISCPPDYPLPPLLWVKHAYGTESLSRIIEGW